MRNTFRVLGGVLLTALSGLCEAIPITSSGDPSLTGATVINFESAPLGSFSTQTIGGVTISGIGGSLTISNDGNGVYVPPQDYFLDNRYGGGVGFDFSFSSAVSAFGLMIGATNSSQVMTAYDSLNNVIETIGIPNQVGTQSYPYTGFYGISAGSGNIARFTISAFAGDWIVLDDLTYASGTVSVPEPASLVLMSLGLVAMGAARRRKV